VPTLRVLLLIMLGSCAGGCTVERMQQDSAQVLGTARLAPQLSVVRSTRWRIDDPGYLTLVAEYDPDDAQQVAYLNAAFLGINRVYPQTALDPVPVVAGAAPTPSVRPVALLIHVDIPRASSGGATRFPVALVDVRTNEVIDRATLTLRPSWWGASHDPADVTRLFQDYAAQLRPNQ
jgi:hypothetical protein